MDESPIFADSKDGRQVDPRSAFPDEAGERVEAGRCAAGLDPGHGGLGGTRALSQLPLGQTGVPARISKKPGGSHIMYDIDLTTYLL